MFKSRNICAILFIFLLTHLIAGYAQDVRTSNSSTNSQQMFDYLRIYAAKAVTWDANSGQEPHVSYSRALKLAKATIHDVEFNGNDWKYVVNEVSIKSVSTLEFEWPVGNQLWYWDFRFIPQPVAGNSLSKYEASQKHVAVHFDGTVVVENPGSTFPIPEPHGVSGNR
jgi:hypothetical protein